MRRIAFALAVLASWSILLLWAAHVDVVAVLAGRAARISGRRFCAGVRRGQRRSGSAAYRVDRRGLHEPAVAASVRSGRGRFPTLRYGSSDFPRTLELSLVFRTAENPEVVAISLPWPGNETRTFDLGRVPEWQGRIVEIGFAEFPTAQQVPPPQGFRPFDIVEAALWSRSWRGDLAALVTDWFAAWPWTQRSVHALGRDTDTPRARSLVLCVALAAGIAIAWLALLFGWRGPKLAIGAAGAIALAWLALDVTWQAGLWGRLATTRAVYAPLSWIEREHTIADIDIADAATKLRVMLRTEPMQSRILVVSDPKSGYELLRFVWHLLPRNVAVLGYAFSAGDVLPDGCLIVFFRSDAWRTDPMMRSLLARSEHLATPASIHGDSFDDEPVVVFRYHRGR